MAMVPHMLPPQLRANCSLGHSSPQRIKEPKPMRLDKRMKPDQGPAAQGALIYSPTVWTAEEFRSLQAPAVPLDINSSASSHYVLFLPWNDRGKK